MDAEILFHLSEDTEEIHLNKERIKSWINRIVSAENKTCGAINFIFCSDDYLLKINRKYLNQDDYTDIITFGYSSFPISGDIYISVDRIKENAATHSNSYFHDELNRVIIHGMLHLLGYKDKTELEKSTMREKESSSLSLLSIL